MPRYTEQDVFAKLDELRKQRAAVRAKEREILAEIKRWLHIGGELRNGDEPVNRTELIDHSGISRRIAYQILDTLPDEHPPA